MKKIALFTSSLSIFFLLGCAYPKKTTSFSPVGKVDGKAIIYVYRTDTSVDSANPDIPRFFINDKLLGKLSLGGYYVETVEPGDTEITYKDSLFGIPLPWKGKSIRISTQANQTYYVKFSIETVFRYVDLKLVPNAHGEKEIANTQLLVN